MPVMTDAEAKVASAQEKLEAAELARSAAVAALEAAQTEYLDATEAWARTADGKAPDLAAARRRDEARGALDRAAKEVDRADVAHCRAIIARFGGRIDYEEAPEEWAELETRPTHEQYVKLRKASGHVKVGGRDDVDTMLDGVNEIVVVLLKAWHVLDRDGNELPLTEEGLKRVPWDRMKPIYERAMTIHRAIPDPNR